MAHGPENTDYQETRDLTEVHAAIKREHADPSVDVTPIPVWLSGVCGAALVWGAAYLGVFHGGFSGKVYNEYDSSPAALFPLPQKAVAAGAGDAAADDPMVLGKAVYGTCAACHLADGKGTAGVNPPLAGSEWVKGNEKRLLAIILKGVKGEIKVAGNTYNSQMQAWEASFNSKKIAAVATYIRGSWGNNASPISVEQVDAVKKELSAHAEQMTQAELLQIPEDAKIDAAAPAAPAASGAAAPAPAAPAPAAATAAAAPAAPAAAGGAMGNAEAGKAVYMQVCVACHQPNGKGLAPVFPTLENTEYVTGDAKRLAAMIIKGVMGPLTVAGTTYNSVMPAQEAMLNDQKIADVLTYVRSSFGNSAPAVSVATVAEARKEFASKTTSWTEAELKAFPAAK